MEYFDFSECQFICERMSFYTYYDFCDNCDRIKKHYKRMNKNARLFYKWYVYANIHMSEFFKNKIWDFLNGYDENGEELYRAKIFYKVK